ncbi:MAG: tRNA (N6-threonylcarbamoyladenosine(37)-N6)-methyltransferase TrmO [Anaerolineaceae bacterium]
MGIIFNPIGIIYTPIKNKEEAPVQSALSEIQGAVEVFPEYTEGLEGIEEFSHIYLLYHLNQSDQAISLLVKPFLDDQIHGVFATRHPFRPNAIGLSIVSLIQRENNRLIFSGADMVDKTPLLDIKPYIPNFDIFEVTKTGWYKSRKYK